VQTSLSAALLAMSRGGNLEQHTIFEDAGLPIAAT
jgi:hypothetical protein